MKRMPFQNQLRRKTNAEQMKFSHTTFHLTLQTTTLHEEKQLNIILEIKNSKLTFQTLTGGWVTSPDSGFQLTTKRWVNCPLRLTGYIKILVL